MMPAMISLRTPYFRRALLLVSALAGLMACAAGGPPTISSRAHPDLDTQGIDRLLEAIDSGRYGEVHSVVIMIDGELVLEAYFAGHSGSERCALYSVTKSVLATLLGLAVMEGHIGSVHDKVLPYFQEYPSVANPLAHKNALTIEHLLGMTAGLQWDELSLPYDDPRNDYRKYLASRDRIKYTLDLPVVCTPGTRFGYNTALSQVLSAILSRACSSSAAEYADDRLFAPLGIDDWRWTAYDRKTSVGGAGLYLRAVDMAKIGQLYLQKGTWNGQGIVPAQWVAAATAPHARVDQWHDYGYHWWRYSRAAAASNLDGHDDIYYALGRGGQYVWVLPYANAVIVCTAWNDNNGYWPEAMLWEHIGPSIRR